MKQFLQKCIVEGSPGADPLNFLVVNSEAGLAQSAQSDWPDGGKFVGDPFV